MIGMSYNLLDRLPLSLYMLKYVLNWLCIDEIRSLISVTKANG